MNQNLSDGLNVIKYQGNSLHKDLSDIITALIDKDQFTQKGFEKSRFFQIIKDRTGLNAEPEVTVTTMPNAAILPPYVNPNHAFFNDFQRAIGKEYFADDFRKLKGDKRGTVDRSTGQVSGFYTDLPATIYIYTGLVNAGLTPEEIAAVVLHEYGHLFNYFDGLHSRFHDMSVMSRAINEANGIKDKYKRRDVLTYALKKVDVEIVDPDELLSEELDENVPLDTIAWGMYIDGTVHRSTVYGDAEYNWRANEQLADQFAVMHGAGPHLASGLRKIHDSPFDKNTSSKGAFIFTEIIKTLYLLFPPTGAFILLYLFVDEQDMTYDRLPKRLRLMRQNLVGEITANYNNPRMVKRLKEDIEFIQQVEASVYDRKSLYDYIQGAIVPRIRRLNRQEKKNIVIEDLIHNDLFISAIKIKQ